jgi:uncharacterized protein (DUF697 family)
VLLERLRSRLVPPLTDDDVLAVAANPAPVRQAGGGWLQMRPNLLPLLARLADILRQEGELLMADNLLLQSQRLGDKARQLLADQRQAQADAIIDRYQWIGAGVIAVTPLPGVDLLATAAINAQMVIELGQVYGCEVSFEEGKALALSLAKTLTGLGLVKGALELLALGLQTNVATVLAGRALQGVSGAYLTRIAGKSFVEYFRHHQSWGDGGMGEVVAEQFRLNQREWPPLFPICKMKPKEIWRIGKIFQISRVDLGIMGILLPAIFVELASAVQIKTADVLFLQALPAAIDCSGVGRTHSIFTADAQIHLVRNAIVARSGIDHHRLTGQQSNGVLVIGFIRCLVGILQVHVDVQAISTFFRYNAGLKLIKVFATRNGPIGIPVCANAGQHNGGSF